MPQVKSGQRRFKSEAAFQCLACRRTVPPHRAPRSHPSTAGIHSARKMRWRECGARIYAPLGNAAVCRDFHQPHRRNIEAGSSPFRAENNEFGEATSLENHRRTEITGDFLKITIKRIPLVLDSSFCTMINTTLPIISCLPSNTSGESEVPNSGPRSPRMLYELSRVHKEGSARGAVCDSIALKKGRTILGKGYGKSGERYAHGEIATAAGSHFIVDRTGKGIRVNGLKLTPKKKTALRHGDCITFSQVDTANELTYVYQRVPPEELRSDVTCSICLEFYTDPHTVTPCGHTFCRDCIGGWLQTSAQLNCPVCREDICMPFAIPSHLARAVLQEYSPAAAYENSLKVHKHSTLRSYITPRVLRKGLLKCIQIDIGTFPQCSTNTLPGIPGAL